MIKENPFTLSQEILRTLTENGQLILERFIVIVVHVIVL